MMLLLLLHASDAAGQSRANELLEKIQAHQDFSLNHAIQLVKELSKLSEAPLLMIAALEMLLRRVIAINLHQPNLAPDNLTGLRAARVMIGVSGAHVDCAANIAKYLA